MRDLLAMALALLPRRSCAATTRRCEVLCFDVPPMVRWADALTVMPAPSAVSRAFANSAA